MKEEYSPRQTAAMKARVRRMRAQYRRNITIAIIVFFMIGIVVGILAQRWFAGRNAAETQVANVVIVTPEPTEQSAPAAQQTPEAWAMNDGNGEQGENIFPEGEAQEENGAEQDAFPEVESAAGNEGEFLEDGTLPNAVEEEQARAATEAPAQAEAAEPKAAEGEAQPEPKAGAEEQPAATGTPLPLTPAANSAEDAAAEAAVEGAIEEAVAEAVVEGAVEEAVTEAAVEGAVEEAVTEAAVEGAVEAAIEGDVSSDLVPEYDPESDVPAEYLNIPDENGIVEAEEGQALTQYGPQVVAIVPYGESFTYTTEIDANGNARVEATDAPYETVSFTQTMKGFMRPIDFANKYSTTYKLQGDEAGAGFELILNDYTGAATIIPQNVIDVSLRSESGNAVERGYQLMDAEIAGNYGIALTTNTPKMLYKRYQYNANGEEMAYLVVTTYKGGDTQMILFQLESDEPEPEPEIIYPILQRGVKNDDVLNMQNRLIELGYLSGTVDGSFGPKTEEAIKAAQAAFGLEQTGIADNAFQQKLFEGAAPRPGEGAGYAPLSNGSTGDAVKRLQARLKELGYYDGKIDGGFGPMMEAAVKKAQNAFGLEQTGIADTDFQTRVFAGTQETSSDAAAGAQTAAAEPTATPAPGVLSEGSTGKEVVRLQMALRDQGFYTGRADGGYGPNTVACVKKAQAAFGMEQTGVADEAFQTRLFGTPEPTVEPTAEPTPEPTAVPAGPVAEGTALTPLGGANTVG